MRTKWPGEVIIKIPQGVSGQDIADAVKEVAGSTFHQAFFAGGEVCELGRDELNSSLDLQVFVRDPSTYQLSGQIDLNEVYQEIYLVHRIWPDILNFGGFVTSQESYASATQFRDGMMRFFVS